MLHAQLIGSWLHVCKKSKLISYYMEVTFWMLIIFGVLMYSDNMFRITHTHFNKNVAETTGTRIKKLYENCYYVSSYLHLQSSSWSRGQVQITAIYSYSVCLFPLIEATYCLMLIIFSALTY